MSTVKKMHLTFLACILLLVLTYGVSHLSLGSWDLVLNLLISATKALLVGLFFMELKGDKGLSLLVIFASFAWPFILFSLTLADYLTR